MQILAVLAWALTACVGVEVQGGRTSDSPQAGDTQVVGADSTSTVSSTIQPATIQPATTQPPATEPRAAEPEPVFTLSGQVVSAVDQSPLSGALVSVGESEVRTGPDGRFVLESVLAAPIEVSRPVWISQTVEWPDTPPASGVEIALDPFVARALRVSSNIAEDAGLFEALLTTASETTVNALVFDTKDESDRVLYKTSVPLALKIGSVESLYDPVDLVARAKAEGLYTITRIVTFEDPAWAAAVPEARLAGSWVDASNEANWDYPIALAVEACSFGFDEIQFDYVRFPSGRTAAQARDLVPQTSQERVAAISGFLAKAKEQLHPMGCGVSAAIFGIVLSSVDDQRLGQTPEGISAVADVISPMLYPSHYNSGWLGLDNPNSHPGVVVGDALDSGMPRLAPGSLMRPWIQGFYYDAEQVLAQIAEAERHGAGWIIWNVFGNYERSWLPPAK